MGHPGALQQTCRGREELYTLSTERSWSPYHNSDPSHPNDTLTVEVKFIRKPLYVKKSHDISVDLNENYPENSKTIIMEDENPIIIKSTLPKCTC